MNQRLYRSRTEVVWTGVAGGVAEWLRMDPSLVRILWVILTPLSGGLALLVYLAMWIVVPLAPYEIPPSAPSTGTAAAPPPAEGTPEPGAVPPPAAVGATPPPPQSPPPARREPSNAGVIIGGGLILLGALFLAREFIPEFRWDFIWPTALILLGAALLLGASRNR